MSKKPSTVSAYLVGYLAGSAVVAGIWMCWSMDKAQPLRNELPPYHRSRQIRQAEPRVLLFHTGP